MAEPIKKRLKHEQTPLIDGDVATFVWRGEKAPDLVSDFTGWEEGKAVKLTEKKRGLWTYQLHLPPDAYIEYNFVQGLENQEDPYNPRQSPNGSGGYNHYFHMPDYLPTTLAEKRNKIPHGIVTRFVIPTEFMAFGSRRTVHLYHPPVERPVPLVVIWDGQDYLHRVHLNLMVDNLIADQQIQPLALAFVHNGGAAARSIEYACNDSTLIFLINKVFPLAREHLNLIDIKTAPGAYGVAGASMGGLMALYTGARLPHVFGKVLSQSGAFCLGSMDTVVFDLLKKYHRRPLKIWMDVGLYDLPSLLACNRRIQNTLVTAGYPLVYREYHAGHNYPAWRDEIWHGLVSLYGQAAPAVTG